MPTKQPEWELIANLGDVHPLDYGGYFIYRDKTGVYPEEAELLILEDDSDENSTYTIYRTGLDRLKLVKGYLVPEKYDKGWPHPVERYDEWFHKDLEGVASFIGIDKKDLEAAFTSKDPLIRADAYQAIGDYHGWDNLDGGPLTGVTRDEAEERYKDDLKHLKKGA